MDNIKIAILDLYNNAPNQGMRSIKTLIEEHSQEIPLTYHIYNVRAKDEVPHLDNYDIYISSGGPGSPFEGEGHQWELNYFHWLEALWNYNEQNHEQKKYAFFICHSFQMIARFFEIGSVCKRKSVSFGVFPVHQTELGKKEAYFKDLTDPFYIVDNREWQVIEPNMQHIRDLGIEVLSIEKERPHIDFERAMMALRFSNEIFATQFHPEADPQGIATYLYEPHRKAEVIEIHGEEKYNSMINQLHDPNKILKTRNTIIPSFLTEAIEHTQKIWVN